MKFTKANIQNVKGSRVRGALSAASGGSRPKIGVQVNALQRSESKLNKAKKRVQHVNHELSEKDKEIVRARRVVKQLRANKIRLGAQKKGAVLKVNKKKGIVKQDRVALASKKAAKGAFDRVRKSRYKKRIKPFTNTATRISHGVQRVGRAVGDTGIATVRFVGNTGKSAVEFAKDPLGIVSNIKSIKF